MLFLVAYICYMFHMMIPTSVKCFFFFSGCFGVAETAKFIHELLSRPQRCTDGLVISLVLGIQSKKI